MKNKKALVALVLALTLIVGAGIGGTVAYLATSTENMTNTFTYGDVNIKLEETDAKGNPTTEGRKDLKIIPGVNTKKDPVVTVKGKSVACYLFVEVTEENWPETGVTYSIEDKWQKGDGAQIPANVWYRTVPENEANQEFPVLKNNEVVVASSLKKGDITTQPKLIFKAYAVQSEGFTGVVEAWAKGKGDAVASSWQ